MTLCEAYQALANILNDKVCREDGQIDFTEEEKGCSENLPMSTGDPEFKRFGEAIKVEWS
ncbi:MAG: hypothetical protein JRH18_22975 [Deltaproteobacteria bacterium]|nr:hypothetical protein [Deltaproteobacteria bacterium]MBW1963546.1 hypothetical protein [Deltaproteobacteria bacterium]MBW2154511.1 hypothetical protein [Deltaproteobacteria bacterium]